MERKFLEGLGITDKSTIDAILDQNGAEVSALNTRLKTATEAEQTLRNDLIAANGKVAELSKVDVTTLQTELENERKGRKADRRNFALMSVLTGAGCTDTDYIRYKLGDSVEYNDDDTVKDAETALKSWTEKFPTFFNKEQEQEPEPAPAGSGSSSNYGVNRGKTPAKKNPYSKEGWNLTKQMELEIANPTEAAKLKAEAEA